MIFVGGLLAPRDTLRQLLVILLQLPPPLRAADRKPLSIQASACHSLLRESLFSPNPKRLHFRNNMQHTEAETFQLRLSSVYRFGQTFHSAEKNQKVKNENARHHHWWQIPGQTPSSEAITVCLGTCQTILSNIPVKSSLKLLLKFGAQRIFFPMQGGHVAKNGITLTSLRLLAAHP